MAIVRSDTGITRAIFICHMEDGTVTCCEGHPFVEQFSIGVENDRDSLDLGQGTTRKDRPSAPRQYATFHGSWSDAKLSLITPPRGWLGRFKKWLKEFPRT